MSSTPSTSNQQQDTEQLRKLFIPTRTKAVGQINEQLSLFRRKKHLGKKFLKKRNFCQKKSLKIIFIFAQIPILSRNIHNLSRYLVLIILQSCDYLKEFCLEHFLI